jgi:hypothetical protein
MGYLDCLQPLHHQSTCQGMTKAMSAEAPAVGRFHGEVAVVRSLP